MNNSQGSTPPPKNHKFQIQEALYEFPYHHIPHFSKNGTPSLLRKLTWGFDYLCYQKHIHEKVVAIKPKSILDVGCGDGHFIGGLPSSIPIRVGVDLSSKSILFAKAFYPECIFHNQDVSTLADRFDIVTAIEVIEHIPEETLSAFLQDLADRVNDHGIIILSMPTTVIPLNKKHYRHYTIDLFQEQLKQSGANLTIQKIEYVFFEPWWLKFIKKLYDNRFFTFEVKPIMHIAWKHIWNKHRIADENTGFHLVVILAKKL